MTRRGWVRTVRVVAALYAPLVAWAAEDVWRNRPWTNRRRSQT